MAFNPAHTRKYEALLRLAAGVAMAGAPPFDEAIKVVVLAVVPVPRSLSKKRHAEAICGQRLPVTRPDADNFAKIALDSLEGVVFRSDSLVTDLKIAKRYGERPCLTITVTPMFGVTHEGAD
jgi:Holliday junction resolvase RusA-like endonuclease